MMYHQRRPKPRLTPAAADTDRSWPQYEAYVIYYFDVAAVEVELFFSDVDHKEEPDFVVTIVNSDEASTPQRVARFVDYAWLEEAKVAQPFWNGAQPEAAVEGLLGWFEDCFRVRCKNVFEKSIGSLSERLAFEYATYLCGIGETSSLPPVSSAANSVAFKLAASRTSPSQIRLSIPLLLPGGSSGADTSSVGERLVAFVELYDKALGGLLLPENMSASCAIRKVQLSYVLAMDVSTSGVVSVTSEKVVMQLSGDGSSGASDIRNVAQSAVNLLDGMPKYLTAIQRTSAAQLIDFVPDLEEVLLSSTFVEPLHFADLVNILLNHYGQPVELSLLATRRDGSSAAPTLSKVNRFVVFNVVDEETLVGVSLVVQYEGRDVLPLVTMTSVQQTLAGSSDRPIRAKVTLQPTALVMHRGATCFDATVMGDAITSEVLERFQMFHKVCAASSCPP